MSVLLRMLLDLLLRFVRSLDLPLLGALLALMGVGLATLYSASNESMRVVLTQGVYFSVGLGALWVASRAPAHMLKQFTPVIYALSILPLVIVLFIGSGSALFCTVASTGAGILPSTQASKILRAIGAAVEAP